MKMLSLEEIVQSFVVERSTTSMSIDDNYSNRIVVVA